MDVLITFVHTSLRFVHYAVRGTLYRNRIVGLEY
jgi:hypothetical protein